MLSMPPSAPAEWWRPVGRWWRWFVEICAKYRCWVVGACVVATFAVVAGILLVHRAQRGREPGMFPPRAVMGAAMAKYKYYPIKHDDDTGILRGRQLRCFYYTRDASTPEGGTVILYTPLDDDTRVIALTTQFTMREKWGWPTTPTDWARFRHNTDFDKMLSEACGISASIPGFEHKSEPKTATNEVKGEFEIERLITYRDPALTPKDREHLRLIDYGLLIVKDRTWRRGPWSEK